MHPVVTVTPAPIPFPVVANLGHPSILVAPYESHALA